MAVHTRANLRRAARLWAAVALVGAPLLAVLGVLLVAGVGPGAQRPVEMWRVGTAGSPVDLPAASTTAVWGRPVAAGVTCTTHRSDGRPVAELVVGEPGDRPDAVEDAGGTGTWTWLATTAGTGAAATVTCSGGGATEVAVSADPARADTPAFGRRLLVLAPVLLVLGLVARRAAAAGSRRDR